MTLGSHTPLSPGFPPKMAIIFPTLQSYYEVLGDMKALCELYPP